MASQNKSSFTTPLNTETLHTAWNGFIETLDMKKNHSAVSNFKSAGLEITDDNCFGIIVNSNLQQKFIDAERSALISHMQQYFNNRLLKYRVTLLEKEEVATGEVKPLSRKQQYLQLIQQYPHIKELKERLKLELD